MNIFAREDCRQLPEDIAKKGIGKLVARAEELVGYSAGSSDGDLTSVASELRICVDCCIGNSAGIIFGNSHRWGNITS